MRMDCLHVAELHDLAEARRVADAFLDRCPGRQALASLKLDGWFCEVRVLPGGAVEWSSKSGNRLRHLSALDWHIRMLPGLLALDRATFDAEITHVSGLVEDVTAALNNSQGGVRDLRVNLFDIRLGSVRLRRRAPLLAEAVAGLCHPQVCAVEHHLTGDPLPEALAYVADGGEGLVLKNPDEVYDPLSSPGWCKVVRADTLDLPVLRVKEGRGAWAGMVATFICAMPDGGLVEVMVGEATHMELRHYLHFPPAMIAVKHRGFTRHGLPRNACFVRPRPDKAPGLRTPDSITTTP